MSIKVIKIFIVLLLLSIKSVGQISGVDHLLPAPKFEEGINTEKGYYGKVTNLLYSGFSSDSRICYTSLPSFSPEYSFSIEPQKDGSHLLKFHSCSENYWYAEDKEKVSVIKKEKTLNTQTAQRVIKLFTEVLSQTQEHVPKEDEVMIIGFDGTTYFFSETKQGEGVQTGKTWSPSTTNMKELVAVCELLRKTDNNLTAALDKRIDKLIRELNKSNSTQAAVVSTAL